MRDRKENKMVQTAVETVVYYITCIASFGVVWLLKIIIKRAIIEANDN